MRKNRNLISILIIVLCISLFSPFGLANASGSETVTILKNNTNIRSGPGLDYKRIAQVQKGDSFKVLKEEGEWLQIQLDSSSKGWVANWLVNDNKTQKDSDTNSLKKGTTVSITADGLRVRSGPGKQYKVIGSFNKGNTVEVTAVEQDWVKVHSESLDGWVAKDYITITNAKQQPGANREKAATTIEKTATVTAKTLRVRNNPSIDGKVIGKVESGKTFSILAEENSWYKIEFAQGKTGWVASWYMKAQENTTVLSALSKGKAGTVEILYNRTNLRKQPSVQSEVVQRADSGEVFDVVNLEKDWYQIRLKNGNTAYVAGWIVSAKGDIAQVEKKSPASGLKNKTIVIDPGHGGKDSGTSGYRGTLEKNLTLETARLLSNKLKAAGANVVMTRTTDRFYSLNSRVRVSHYHGADAFISIHYDSIPERYVRGMTSFYYHSYQKQLALTLNQALSQSTNIKNRGTRFGDYYVIRENKQRAVLLELGYLSNPTEESILTSSNYQEKAANGIFQGLANYFK